MDVPFAIVSNVGTDVAHAQRWSTRRPHDSPTVLDDNDKPNWTERPEHDFSGSDEDRPNVGRNPDPAPGNDGAGHRRCCLHHSVAVEIGEMVSDFADLDNGGRDDDHVPIGLGNVLDCVGDRRAVRSGTDVVDRLCRWKRSSTIVPQAGS
jgi:hypothetical protein